MNTFESIFGHRPETSSKTFGRVNLIGEHTDYNGGFVLPTCIPQETFLELRKRTDNTVRVASLNIDTKSKMGVPEMVEYTLGNEKPTHQWVDYIQGTTFILQSTLSGKPLTGFDCLIQSHVPIGSGLSSSAALVVGTMKALNEAFQLNLQKTPIAQLAQRVENGFVGAKVGIMDQMVVSHGQIGDALFIDTRSLEIKPLKLPLDCVELLVINSGIKQSNVHGGGYNERRSQCEEACKLLGVKQLRDISSDDLHRLDKLPPLLLKRARHVVTENQRVLEAVSALEKKDFVTLGELFAKSHQSMRDDYEVSVQEVDLLVELCSAHKEVYGARFTGGGFGGSIAALVHKGFASEVAKTVKTQFDTMSGSKATILVPELNAGKTNEMHTQI